MAFFTGEHECKLDAKGRLVLPSRLKSVLPEASKKSIIVRKGFESNLILYPITEFQNIYTRINSLNEFSSEQRKLKRNLFLNIRSIHELMHFRNSHKLSKNTQNEYKSDKVCVVCACYWVTMA